MTTASTRPGIGDYLSLVKFSHSVFALPFAIISLLLATHGKPGLLLLVQVVLAAVAARTAAMAFNRSWVISPDTPEFGVYTIQVNVNWTGNAGAQTVQLETFKSEF